MPDVGYDIVSNGQNRPKNGPKYKSAIGKKVALRAPALSITALLAPNPKKATRDSGKNNTIPIIS
jgi:hypothetical protein